MKLAIIIMALVLISSSPLADFTSKKIMSMNVKAPNDLEIDGSVYEDGSWDGLGIKKIQDGGNVYMKIFDLSYFPEMGYVHVCVGITDQDSTCADYAYSEGETHQTTDWIGGQGDFVVTSTSLA